MLGQNVPRSLGLPDRGTFVFLGDANVPRSAELDERGTFVSDAARRLEAAAVAYARGVNEHSIRLTPWMNDAERNISGGPASMSGIRRSISPNIERS